MQVETLSNPVKPYQTLSNPRLKPPGTKRLTLKCDESLSNFAFNFNLRHYSKDAGVAAGRMERRVLISANVTAVLEVGTYTRSLLSSTLALSMG